MRAISAPPSRPETCTWTLGPRAHRRGQARFIARRNATVLELLPDRLGDELASSSGRLISRMFTRTGFCVSWCRSRLQRVDLGARLPDHDPRTRGVDVDRDLAALLSDRDVREARVGEAALDMIANLEVLEQVVGELALVEPVRLPSVDVADPEALWVDLLAARSLLLVHRGEEQRTGGRFVGRSSSRGPRASAPARSVGPSSTKISAISRSSATRSWLFSAFAAAESITFATSRAAPLGELEQRPRVVDLQAAHLVGDLAHLAGRRTQERALARTTGLSAASATLIVPLACPVPEWARKVLVGANSPSLWPTIDSETNTGTCLRRRERRSCGRPSPGRSSSHATRS